MQCTLLKGTKNIFYPFDQWFLMQIQTELSLSVNHFLIFIDTLK